MKQGFINTERIEGRVYQHNLVLKTVQNETSPNFGKEFISGTLDIATDEEGLNVITVHFTYVTEITRKKTKNQTFTALQKIMNEGKTWVEDGKDEAIKVRVNTSLALNDFYGQDDSLVSVKTNEGGFVSIISQLSDPSERNTFNMDMLITSVTPVEPNEEKGILEPYASLRGAVFNFRKDILPVEFVVKSEGGMKYFEDADITGSNPMFTKVWGKIVSATSFTEYSEDTAFGEAAIKRYEKKTKEWVVTGASKVPYDFGDESVLTAEEVTAATQAREVHLAEIKQRNDDWKANRATNAMMSDSGIPKVSGTAKVEEFNF